MKRFIFAFAQYFQLRLLKTIENSEYQSGRCPPNLGITMLTKSTENGVKLL